MTWAAWVVAAAVALGGAASAAAEVRITGRGFGHGIGLSQWGAYGYALREDRSFRWILGHYYPRTTLERAPKRRIRVLLKRTRTQKVCSASRARDARGRVIRLSEARAYRFSPWQADGVTVTDTTTQRRRARLHAPVRITGGASTCLRGVAENGRADGAYRGALLLLRDGSRVPVVNDVALRHYLYGVVPSEVPASWPVAALQAQAVAARSYALRALKPAAPYDVLPDTRSQVYGGLDAEHPVTSAAVDATDPLVVEYGGEVAATYFSASSGGRTAAVEEGFPGATPVPYLVAVDDPHDDLSPYHEWTATFSDSDAAERLDDLLHGELVSLAVTARTPGGRALTVHVADTAGERPIPATQLRALLGLRSTWFEISSREPAAAPRA